MSFVKREYSPRQTVITSENLNDIQDELIRLDEAKYEKPAGGIPKTDLTDEVKTSLGKADTALQQHQPLTAYRTAAAQDEIDALLGSTISGTTQTVTFDANGKPQRIVHTANNAAVRTDVFTWGENSVTELRTLANGKHITITTNLTTLETVITGIEEAA